MLQSHSMAAAVQKMPAAVRRWMGKLKPAELGELAELAERRRQMMMRPAMPIDDAFLESLERDYAGTLDALRVYDER